jgi:RNA polymerase-binding protein DksA
MAKTSTKKPASKAKSTKTSKPSGKGSPAVKKATAFKAKAKSVPALPKKPVKPVVPIKKTAKPIKPAKIAPKPPAKPEYIPPPPQAPVPTDGKPRKNQAGIHVRDLEHYREMLLSKRRELVGDMSSMEREALRSTSGTNLSNLPMHMADMGTDNYEQEFTLGLMEKDRNLLREINQALAKIQDGTYGICEGTGKPIGRPRLEAQPWAKFSIEHARKLERGMLR